MTEWMAYRHKESGEYLTGQTWVVERTRQKDQWEQVPVPTFRDRLVYEGYEINNGATFIFRGRTQKWKVSPNGLDRFISLMDQGIYEGNVTLVKRGNAIYAFPA